MGLRTHNVYDQIVENARLFPQKQAFVIGELRRSFSEYLTEVNQLAAGFRKQGLQTQDRLTILMDNSWEFLLCYGACAQLGLVMVPLNVRTSTDEMGLVLKNTEPKIFIFGENYQEEAQTLKKSYNWEACYQTGKNSVDLSFSDLVLEEGYTQVVTGKSTDAYVIIPTAATDGFPKGAVLSQENVMAASSMQLLEYGREAVSAQLAFLPLFHILGLSAIMTTFVSGGINVLMPRFDAAKAVTLIDQEKLTYFGSFPPLLGGILDQAKEQGSQLTSLKLVFGIEGPPMIERLQTETQAEFWVGFGQAETSAFVTTGRFSQYPDTAGVANPFNAVALMDEEGNLVPNGEAGEIVVRGPLVFQGYWKREEANAHVFRFGWHHTGDKGKLNDQGALVYLGRLPEKELIKTGGENVYPKEVEEALTKHAKINAAVVFGVPDEQWGEAIKAVIELVPESQLTLKEVRDFVGQHIAGFKRPKHVVFVENLAGKQNKVDREAVKKRFAEQ
ncbi:MAG: AMP-dependent synthetase [SAR324 cluster bacterium]|uniref:AMP-dependent synthetase n=1 Tax=SAR324 cluster bacterium TaxID=2024889 RepID=A0A2A4T5U9_9DELT|nr:MAG: AMP-dependent synthetase [SAR324 cluster bacterium]